MKSFAKRTRHLKQSEIRALTQTIERVNGINLGQGICDMPTPDAIKAGAIQAIEEDRSIYTSYAGTAALREKILHKARMFNALPCTSIDKTACQPSDGRVRTGSGWPGCLLLNWLGVGS